MIEKEWINIFLTSSSKEGLNSNLESIGLKKDLSSKKDVLIKINLAKVYKPNYPRTDMEILISVLEYVYQNGGKCAIAEGANGYLVENLYLSGLGGYIKKYGVKIIDIDFEDCDEVISYDECHYIPKCFKDYSLRIAIPVTSKRQDRLYSNNIKLFVGSVPRKMYQLENPCSSLELFPRPRLHLNIDMSVANIYFAIQEYSRFNYFINGGLSYNEKIGEFNFTETFIGNDAFELDCYIYEKFFLDCDYPKYLRIINEKKSN